nr:unnamed protein product [Digitaria exilis]
MASSPVKFFSVFLAVSVVGWVVFTFAARLLTWFLSRVLSASVGFRVAGFNCLRDVTIKFNKGSVESVSIGEIKLSFRKSLVKLSFGFISKDPKLQLLINDLEIVTRSSSHNNKLRKSAKPRSTGKGKWLVTSSMARLLSVSVTDLMIKVPKGAIDIKELTVDTLKIAGPNHILGVKSHLLPLNVHFGDLGLTADPTGSCNLHDAFQSDQASVSNSEKSLAPFVCEDLLVTCDLGHEKEKGIKIINLELKCGHVIANIDERMFHKQSIPEYNTVSSNTGDAIMDTSAFKQTSKSKSVLPALKKQMLTFPDKLFREGSSSLLEVLKVFAIATFDVPVDPFLPIRAEIDAKLGGTQCNVMLSSLMPWIRLHSLRTRGMKLSKRNSNQELSQKKEFKIILWTCTVAAPETAIVLYSVNGLALYHQTDGHVDVSAKEFKMYISSIENITKKCRLESITKDLSSGKMADDDFPTMNLGAHDLAWDTGRSLEISYVRSEFEDDSESDHNLSEPSDDDDDFNVVLADNCQRVFVYGLKILWTLGNRDAVWSWVGGISKAFEPPKPSPSRQYEQRKMIEKRNAEGSKLVQDASSSIHVGSTSVQPVDASGSSSPFHSKANCSSEKDVKRGIFDDSDKGGTPQFMVNVYTPQFNLQGPEANVKPLKELCFNSPDITATMTSRQFQVMFDVLRNLLLARLPKPRISSLQYPSDDEDIEQETDEVVPDGVEEVELAKINLEQMDREMKLVLDDIRCLTGCGDNGTDYCYSLDKGDCSWIISTTKTSLVKPLGLDSVAGLNKDFEKLKTSRKDGSSKLREALQKAAQPHLMEKEKNKTLSCAMRISMKISKVVWSMLADGNTFAEAEINDMVCDFDRDYKDIGVARFTTKYFVVRNCMANAKCDTLLSAWNTPPGKINMLRVDAKQGAPKDGNSPLELFQVEIYPLRIYLSEAMYRMMWDYFFPEEDDSQRRQVSKFQSIKANMVCGSHQEFRRPSSFERTWDEIAAESVISNDVVSLVNSSTISSKADVKNSLSENPVVGTDLRRSRIKDSKPAKSGRLSHEDKKVGKSNDEKKTRARKSMEFRNIKISQVELLVTYEGSRLAINDLRLLMDTFHKSEFTASWLKRPGDGAGDGFVTSIRGLFNTQRRKAKAFVIRTMRGDGHNDEYQEEWSESDGEYPFARQLTITKAKKLIRKKFRPRGQKNSGLSLQDSLPSSPRETTPYQSDSSRSSYEDFHE